MSDSGSYRAPLWVRWAIYYELMLLLALIGCFAAFGDIAATVAFTALLIASLVAVAVLKMWP